MRRIAALVVLAAALALPAAAQEPAQPSVSIRLVDAPEERRDDPLARVYIVDHVQPGDRIERKVAVGYQNDTKPIEVDLYVAPADVEDGAFQFGSRGEESDLTEWSTVDPGRVSVSPGAETEATVTIAVPDDATDGERYGVVWAELPGSGGATNVVNRVGVRIYLSVGEGQEPVTDFEIAALTAARDDDGRPMVETAVRNTGGRAINLTGELVLEDGPGGLSTKPYGLELGTTLAPGDSEPTVAVLDDDLPDGPWKATVTIQAGRVEKSARATITFPGEAAARSEAVKVDDNATERKILGPIAAVLAAAVLAASVLAVRGLRVRRRRTS